MYKQIDSNKRRTLFLMFFMFIFIGGLGYVFSLVLGEPSFFPIAVVFGIIYNLSAFFWSEKVVLLISGARPIPRNAETEKVYDIVENLCITSGLPMPQLYLMEDMAINAFATGRNPQKSHIAMTRGCIEKLDKNELQGVLSHELSHIKNYDIRLMTIVTVLIGIIALMSDLFLRTMFSTKRDSNNDGGGQIKIILFVIGIVLAILAPIFAQLIQLAISRKREFLADADGALLTRYPEGLALALEKIAGDNDFVDRANNATAHLFIANPLPRTGIRASFSKFFSTHPPIKERVAALRAML